MALQLVRVQSVRRRYQERERGEKEEEEEGGGSQRDFRQEEEPNRLHTSPQARSRRHRNR